MENYEQKHPILQKLDEYLKTTPKEQIDKDWSDILKETDSESYYEQKYKEALERAKGLWEQGMMTERIEYIFPELKKSKDERIRKTIYGWIYTQPSQFFDNGFSKEEMLAWVEKQGQEPKKLKPKFKIGDWIVGSEVIFKVAQYEDEYGYELTDTTGYVAHSVSPDYVESNFHLWTINDAKDGDVLVCKGNIKDSNGIKYERICLFNNIGKAFFTLTKTSNYVEEYDINVNIDYPDNTIPATKEQKEILFMAMREAGYEWDNKNKKLKKIEPKKLDADKVIEWLKPLHHGRIIDGIINKFKEDFGL